MPLTFFAHQLPALPLKMRWPRYFDGTALCVGSMVPDLSYPFLQAGISGHSAEGLIRWCLPATLVITLAIRTWVASSAFAQIPDLGRFRLRSFRVLAARRPAVWQTVTSALIGAITHIWLDSFTHADRNASMFLGLDARVPFDVRFGPPLTYARMLQGFLHVFGSLACVGILWVIGNRRLLDRWYGEEIVARHRDSYVSTPQRWAFWSIVGLGVPVALIWTIGRPGAVFHLIDALAISTAIACLVVRPKSSPTVNREATSAV